MGYFDQVVYASANEDGRSELRAVALRRGDVAVAVLGSGARALDLLLSDASEVVGVDANVHQCRLAALKVAAWSTLAHDRLLSFLGIAPGDPLDLYRAEVHRALLPDDRAYWDARPEQVRAGVIYGGAWERNFRWFARAASVKRRTLDRLFAARSLEEQRHIWVHEWCDARWRLGLRLFGLRAVWRHVLREPGIERVPPGVDLGARMGALFDRAAERHLFADNAYLRIVLTGRYDPAGPLPLHLRADRFDAVRAGLSRLRLVHAPLERWLSEQPARSVHAFSLSDVSSYADDAVHRAIWAGVRHAAAPGARVCERHFLAPRPPDGGPAFTRDEALEAELERSDDTFLYTFVCGAFA